MKKILIISGHSADDSLGESLARSYAKGSKTAGHKTRFLELGKLKFDPILHEGYKKIQKLEPDLQKAQKDIKWADHLVFVYPIWWGTMPALLKGFVDRVFLPGFAFKFNRGSVFPEKLLKDKTANLIITMDTPLLILRKGICFLNFILVKYTILNFCGINKVKMTTIGSVTKANEKTIKKWLDKIFKKGVKGL